MLLEVNNETHVYELLVYIAGEAEWEIILINVQFPLTDLVIYCHSNVYIRFYLNVFSVCFVLLCHLLTFAWRIEMSHQFADKHESTNLVSPCHKSGQGQARFVCVASHYQDDGNRLLGV